jgi:hypothetical protein
MNDNSEGSVQNIPGQRSRSVSQYMHLSIGPGLFFLGRIAPTHVFCSSFSNENLPADVINTSLFKKPHETIARLLKTLDTCLLQYERQILST